MPRRRALTEAQNLLALPVIEANLIRHWTLTDADLAVIERRHQPDLRRSRRTTRLLGRAGALEQLDPHHLDSDPFPLAGPALDQQAADLGVVVIGIALDGVEDRLGQVVQIEPGRVAG